MPSHLASPLPAAHARRTIALATALLLGGGAAWAQQSDVTPFDLGTIYVVGKRPSVGDVGADQVSSVVTRQDMRTFNRGNVGDALNLLSGVTVTANGRNEKVIYVRGFDTREAPLFIDGIPVYVPYDGYVDFNRFVTSNLAAIQVTKGFSSVAYGPNALAGAINLVTRKPRERFEGDASVGVGSSKGRQAEVNLGTNQGMWYVQMGASYSQADGFPLSDNFTPTLTEDGGLRNNSAHHDGNLSLKLGLTPNAHDEYTLSYYKLNGEKGQPPSTTANPPSSANYWVWPYWNKEGVYFISKTAITPAENLKVRLYHDDYDNEALYYTDATYTVFRSQFGNPTGHSIYHDRTHGASLELESVRWAGNTLRAVAQTKTDTHTSVDSANTLYENYQDKLSSVGLEDNYEISSQLTASAGVARQTLSPQRVYNVSNHFGLPGDKSANNAQAGLFYDWTPQARVYATIAGKTRLPTLKDRYSQKSGTYVENPNLQPEKSTNYETGYQGQPWAGGHVETALFFSNIHDKIQSVANVSGTKSQMQNVGKVHASGLEASIKQALAAWADVGGSYTYTVLKNVGDPATRLTDVPRNKLTAYAQVRPADAWSIVPFAEFDSGRWVSNTLRLGGFATLNAKVVYQPSKPLSIEAGINNLTDHNLSMSSGYPNPGRTWFANANYQF
ncbi:TonB-dependent receptor plug domain-containing protein [Aquabacterium sp.]|uniref:TonB-dependent receptor plug domain-containing protein n=1 Tax=Aquabacterium sp. TaxID=1872578 RepID=UPI0035B0C0D5